MARDLHHAQKLCLRLKLSVPEVAFVTNLLSAHPWSLVASMHVHPRMFPDFPSVGLRVKASTSTCLGDARYCLQKRSKRTSSVTLQPPALSGHASDGEARGDAKYEKGRGNRGSNISSAVSNLIPSISQFINACMFSLPNLAAL